jgi:hypothetical protein
MQQKIIQTTENAIKSLKINWGVAKGDVIIDNDKPKEVTLYENGIKIGKDITVDITKLKDINSDEED